MALFKLNGNLERPELSDFCQMIDESHGTELHRAAGLNRPKLAYNAFEKALG